MKHLAAGKNKVRRPLITLPKGSAQPAVARPSRDVAEAGANEVELVASPCSSGRNSTVPPVAVASTEKAEVYNALCKAGR